MTRVCLVGASDVNLRYELLSRETSREALTTYDLERPFENTLQIHTVSIGAAVTFCNDLEWYLIRFVDDVFVYDESVAAGEWLSRDLAKALRNGELTPPETGEYLKVYGLEPVATETAPSESTREAGTEKQADETGSDADSITESDAATGPSHRLVEPLYCRRTDGHKPAYDLRDVTDTLVVRLTEREFTSS